jgi:hypothetical protein
MSVPLRNDQPEELTTADLARKRPARVEEMRPASVLSDTDTELITSDAAAAETAPTTRQATGG